MEWDCQTQIHIQQKTDIVIKNTTDQTWRNKTVHIKLFRFIKRNFYDNPKRIELHLTSNKKQ